MVLIRDEPNGLAVAPAESPSGVCLTIQRRFHGVGHRSARGAVLTAVPAVAIVIDLVHLFRLRVTNAVECRHARVRANGVAWIDLLDLRRVGKDLELDDSFGHGANWRLGQCVRLALAVKVGNTHSALKREYLAARTVGSVSFAYDRTNHDSRD